MERTPLTTNINVPADTRLDTVFSSSPSIGPVQRNFPDQNPNPNLFFASGGGPQLSYASWFDNPRTKSQDTTYVQVAAKMQSQQEAEIAEYTVYLDSFFNTGYAGIWQSGRLYQVGERARRNGSLYKVVQAGVSAGGPSGTGSFIGDGGAAWAYLGSSELDNKAGFNHVTQVGAGAGHVWGSALNTIQLPGVRSDFVCNVEFDVGNYARSCLQKAISYNVWTYGVSHFPITAAWCNSSPESTPAVGVPKPWTPNTVYTIDPALGAPIVSNGGRYYYLKTPGTSAASGGPAGIEMYVDLHDGSCMWHLYDAEFMQTSYGTSPYLGGLAGYGMLFQGYNSVQEAVLMDATHSRIGIAADRGAKHELAFIADFSVSTVSYRPAGTYAYATIEDISSAPWGIRADGNYSVGAYKYRDLIIGPWDADESYNALAFNGTFNPTFMNGWFGKASDPYFYGNAQAGYHFRVRNDTKFMVEIARTSVKNTFNVSRSTPAQSTSGGAEGDFAWDNDAIYICVAPNTWKKASLVSF